MTQNEKEFLAEVQDLGSNYNFYMVDNNIRHLWGVLAKKDGVDYAIGNLSSGLSLSISPKFRSNRILQIYLMRDIFYIPLKIGMKSPVRLIS